MNESNPKPPPAGATAKIQSPVPPAPLKANSTRTPILNSWRTRVWKLLKQVVAIGGSVTTLLWAAALVDSYRPKITITPSGTLNSKQAFETEFIIQNQSALSIRDIVYKASWVDGNPTTMRRPVTYIDTDASVIRDLKPLEEHSLHCDFGPGQKAPQDAVSLWFNVTYKPKFFGSREEVFYFWAGKDAGGNWQWFPSGHHDFWMPAISITNPTPVTITTNITTNPPPISDPATARRR